LILQSPYNYTKLLDDLYQLKKWSPFVQSEIIGQSVMGKNIIAIGIGNGPRELHFNAGMHANEWITSALLMQFAKDYIHEKNGFMEQKTLWLVPMLNPDGIDLVQEGVEENHPFAKLLIEWNDGSTDFSKWKANIHGVDLNDQFPAHWSCELARRKTDKPGPSNYSGTGPLTEPEAMAIASFTNRHSFQLALSLHTQGEEIYWNYRDMEPAQSLEWANEFAHLSGYKAVKLYDSDAGYKDWFIQETRRPGFTVEAGIGSNPLPLEQFGSMYRKVRQILWRAWEKVQPV